MMSNDLRGSTGANRQIDSAHNQGPFAFTLLGTQMTRPDLTKHVRMERYLIATGGYSDIMTGYVSSNCLPCTPMHIENGEVKVAIKRFRASLLGKEKYVKVWLSLRMKRGK